MDGRKVVAATAMLLALGAPAAYAAPGVTVSQVSSLKGTSGTLTGTVVNETSRPASRKLTVHLLRRGTKRALVGSTPVKVAAKGKTSYRVNVKLPDGLAKGTYYLAACTPYNANDGRYGCATAHEDVLIGGGSRVRPPLARATQAETCSSGARTLSKPGTRVYPETGNGGYLSLHTDVYNVYDAVANLFLPGNHVDLTQRSTQCLTDFSLDFERSNTNATAGPNMTVSEVRINDQPVSFRFAQPTYPGDPNGPDDPDPLAHQASLTNPVGGAGANPLPPACTPPGTGAALQGQPCPATKLVITPSAPIPSGTEFKVTVSYTGRPGVHIDGDGSTEGWFRNNNPVGDGSFVTTEPLGTMAWMPLNNHPTVKPTYDFYDTVTAGRTAIGNGRLVGFVDNPDGTRTWHWKSPEPIASYLVENSMGNYELTERFAPSGVIYYEAQSSAIPAAQKATNAAVMHQQEDITLFQTQFNGPFPFSTNGVIVGIPTAGFEEEMQTKITFQRSRISLGVFHHENQHQWWGDNVSEGAYNLTFFKEGYADMSEGFASARTAATNAGGLGTPAGDAAFETSLRTRFNGTYGSTGSFWTVAPSNPQSNNLFGGSNTYSRPGASYLALRAILGKDRFNSASKEIQATYGGGSITEAQEIAVFHKWLENQSAECSARLDEFFREWWDTAYPTGGGRNKPSITGPGQNGTNFYNSAGGCTNGVGGTVPATLSLTLGTPASFGAFAPGIDHDYTAATTANVISSAGDAALSVSDPGHLMNGSFSLPSPLEVAFSKSTWDAPVSNDPVTISFKQHIGATDALRTGIYSKTLTFTLSTTNP